MLEQSLDVLRRAGLCTSLVDGRVVCGHTALWEENGEPRCRQHRSKGQGYAAR